ncbi:lysine exporter LysO family protein [Bacilliculturomica massiliensis]|uniref:lysine exporter LysO family protein n=1 Tax=Bacilliculturomica massiliensis TaxID=1917867 RepID=UPI001FED13B2|nr:lysine exporter LysO family protein [Bacilliculturomica massiliensis]
MTRSIVAAVTAGILAGYFIAPEALVRSCGALITGGLCLLLFLVGLDIGRQGTILEDIKKVGFRVLLFPVAVIVGTLVFAAASSLLLPLSPRETMAVASGLGWYSLAPMLLAEYSASLSAMSFLSNVMREVLSIVLIPFVAKYIGHTECIALPAAAAMDTTLPIVVGATSDRIAIYSITSGVVLSFAVPVLVPLVMEL